MNLLHRIRCCSDTLSRVNLGLFALIWLSIAIAPCAMAMQADAMAAQHECPHCPPNPCAEVAPQDCEGPDSLNSLRIVEKAETIALLPPSAFGPSVLIPITRVQPPTFSLPPVRAGPRAHLLHAQFNE